MSELRFKVQWQPATVVERVLVVRWRWVQVAALVATLTTACTGARAAHTGHTAPGDAKVSVGLTAGGGTTIVLGTPRRLKLTVRNLTDDPQSGLALGMSDTIGGSPGSASEYWRPRFSKGCDTAAGTTYCPLPTIAAHGAYRATLNVKVPERFGNQSTIGLDFVQRAYVTPAPSQGPTTPIQTVRLHIVRK